MMMMMMMMMMMTMVTTLMVSQLLWACALGRRCLFCAVRHGHRRVAGQPRNCSLDWDRRVRDRGGWPQAGGQHARAGHGLRAHGKGQPHHLSIESVAGGQQHWRQRN
jgi:hypothetical protein